MHRANVLAAAASAKAGQSRDLDSDGCLVGNTERALPAYSGGTVWALHPTSLTAWVRVGCGREYNMWENSQLMSKSSALTARETPVQPVASATAGDLVIHGESFVIDTTDRIQVLDLTDRVTKHAAQFRIREGVLTLWSMHTTCALFINEFQTALVADVTRFLEDIVRRDRYYMHNDPEHSDCDRMNADSHLRATLLGHSLTLQISGGEVVLGQWQRILLAELDGPRARTIRLQVMGIGSN